MEGGNMPSMSFFDKISKFISYWYYQYILHTALYMLESWERSIFNSLLIAIIAASCYTTYIFLPGHIVMLGRFFENLTGYEVLGSQSSILAQDSETYVQHGS